ncbi:MAG: VWA domain-containing protein [Candidatus Schekmanbacteria bacterium]|nr:VWA domain-containing protein [Candidatus Schekmanbacteria bacterium]
MTFATPETLWALAPVLGILLVTGLLRRRAIRELRAATGSVAAASLFPPALLRRFAGDALTPLAFVALILALAEPQWGNIEQAAVWQGVDVMIALDTSWSMGVRDVAPSRFLLARDAARRIVEKLDGYRVGLMVFSGGAYVLCPLTRDRGLIELFLSVVEVGFYPAPGTALAPAIDAMLADAEPGEADGRARVLIVLSDGEDLAGRWELSARRAAAAGLLIHALGVGTEGGGTVPVDPRAPEGPVRLDRDGKPGRSALRESVLRDLARKTGGRYEKLSAQGGAVGEILREIGALQRRESGAAERYRNVPRFALFLLVAIILFFAEMLSCIIPSRHSPAAVAPGRRSLLPAIVAGLITMGTAIVSAAEPDQAFWRAQLTQDELALAMGADSAELHYNIGSTLLRLGLPAAAVEHLRRAAHAPELTARAYYNLGSCLFQLRRTAEAIAAFREALIAAPGDRDARIFLEIALRRHQAQPEPAPEASGGTGGDAGDSSSGDAAAGGAPNVTAPDQDTDPWLLTAVEREESDTLRAHVLDQFADRPRSTAPDW